MSDVLKRDAFLAAIAQPDINTSDVEVPGLGVVRVREMTGAVRNRLEAAYAAIQSGGNTKVLDEVTSLILANCVIDENGTPILTANDAKRLLAARPRAAFKLRDSIIELSSMTEDDVEAFAEVFEHAQSEDSTSD